MELRLATEMDKEKIKELWSYSFETYEPYFSWYFDKIYRPERTLCCFKGNELLSSLQLAPYQMSLRGKIFDFNYIVGVITSPQARDKGIAASIINKAFILLKQKDIPLAVLKPVCPSFYSSFGFNFTYEELIWQMKITRLKELAFNYRGSWHKYHDSSDIKDLDHIYEKMSCQRNGYILRKEENWQNFLDEHLQEGYRLFILRNGSEPHAYILYSLKDRKLNIRELGYTCDQAMRKAFHFIYHHLNEADTFEWHAEKANSTYLDLANIEGLTLKPSIMSRIIDLPALLEKIHYSSDDDFELDISVTDQNLPWNNGNFHVMRKDCQVHVECRENNSEKQIKTDIKALTALIFGHLSVKQLYLKAQISGNSNELDRLSQLLPPLDNYLNEYS